MGRINRISTAFFQSLDIIKKDKKIIFLSLFPIGIGIFLYGSLGYWLLYGGLLDFLKDEILTLGIGDKWGTFVEYVLKGIIIFTFYCLFSWGFVIIVSFLSCPFNDAISTRTEKMLTGVQKTHSMGMIGTLFNEVRKMIFLLGFLLLGWLVLLFIPFLDPILWPLISSLVLAIAFIDYSWVRHGYRLVRCLRDIWGNYFVYTATGFIALILTSIPVVNLLAVPFAVIYFTVIFTDGLERQKTQ